MSAKYYHLTPSLKANKSQNFQVPEGSSFVLNDSEGGVIRCQVDSNPEFTLRIAQTNRHLEDGFRNLKLKSDIDQTIDIRVGVNGEDVSPPQRERMSIEGGNLVTSLDAADIQAIADANEKHTVPKANDTLEDQTIATHATAVTEIAPFDDDVLETVIQRIDNNSGVARVDGSPAADKGIQMISQDIQIFSGSGSISVFNNSGNPAIFAISRRKKL